MMVPSAVLRIFSLDIFFSFLSFSYQEETLPGRKSNSWESELKFRKYDEK